ncbi:MAG: hemerythrin family protein [Pseudomonadota bacterium]
MSDESGTASIDGALDQMRAEHDQLIRTVDEIKQAIGANDVAGATKLIVQLQVHQQAHFDHEVALMERYRYPHADHHQTSHTSLIDTLHSIYRLISLENLHQLSDELAEYLEKSMQHIIEVDRPLQDFLNIARDGDD